MFYFREQLSKKNFTDFKLALGQISFMNGWLVNFSIGFGIYFFSIFPLEVPPRVNKVNTE